MRSEASNILILGGTAEARSLAATLVADGLDVESSLAGRVSSPRLPAGRVRIGGFGGASGLARYLQEQRITHLIDATHPFAAHMSAHAVEAIQQVDGVSLLRLVRPGWGEHPDAPSWHWVPYLAAAPVVVDGRGHRPVRTTGRQSRPFFADLRAEQVLIRVVDPMDAPKPSWTVVLDRGPYEVCDETELMKRHGVDVLVTKDSGGIYTSAKLAAAASLDIPVVVVSRPEPGATQGGLCVTTAADIPEVLAWLSRSARMLQPPTMRG